MLSISIEMYFRTLLIFCIISFGYGVDRKITAVVNPGWNNKTLDTTLLYVRADSSNDTIHQIWDFTRGMPTMIFLVSNLQSALNITWSDSKPVDVTLIGQPIYSFAVVFDQIFEYDDDKDIGKIDVHSEKKHSHRLDKVKWHRQKIEISDKEVLLRIASNHWKLGVVEMTLDLVPYVDYGRELPHLIHSSNSTLVDINLVNLTSTQHYNSTRFAVHLLLVSSDATTDTMHRVIRKSLDDEHTPGVFEIIEIKTPAAYRNETGGFLQFNPIGYTQTERSVTASTNAHVSDFERKDLPYGSTVERFFRRYPMPLVQDMYVSFGETGDGFYAQHNYTSWSFTIGYGVPPEEKFSFFVIMVICVGLGVPVLLALSGIVYVVMSRHRQRIARTRFTNED